jgi:hypothetical protein
MTAKTAVIFRTAAEQQSSNRQIAAETETRTMNCDETGAGKQKAQANISTTMQARKIPLEHEHTRESAPKAQREQRTDRAESRAEFYDHSGKNEARPQTGSEANEHKQSSTAGLRPQANT